MNIRWWLTRVVLAAAVIVGVSAVPSTAFAGGFKVPFTDPNQVGSLTLCNTYEQPITSGSLLTVPFVWRAVSSARVPAGYTGATLDLFQPIQYEPPGNWSGYQLTASARFSNPAHPMAQATYVDAPLTWPDHAMPPYWDGLYQLRMFFSSPDKQAWSFSYPAAVIKVTGNTWTLVQGGGSSCTDGTAESVESLYLPRSETAVPPADRGKRGSTSPGTTKKGSASPTTTAQAGGGNSKTTIVPRSGSSRASGDPVGTSSKGAGSFVGAIAGGVIAALVLAGAAALLVFRRRRRVAA